MFSEWQVQGTQNQQGSLNNAKLERGNEIAFQIQLPSPSSRLPRSTVEAIVDAQLTALKSIWDAMDKAGLVKVGLPTASGNSVGGRRSNANSSRREREPSATRKKPAKDKEKQKEKDNADIEEHKTDDSPAGGGLVDRLATWKTHWSRIASSPDVECEVRWGSLSEAGSGDFHSGVPLDMFLSLFRRISNLSNNAPNDKGNRGWRLSIDVYYEDMRFTFDIDGRDDGGRGAPRHCVAVNRLTHVDALAREWREAIAVVTEAGAAAVKEAGTDSKDTLALRLSLKSEVPLRLQNRVANADEVAVFWKSKFGEFWIRFCCYGCYVFYLLSRTHRPQGNPGASQVSQNHHHKQALRGHIG